MSDGPCNQPPVLLYLFSRSHSSANPFPASSCSSSPPATNRALERKKRWAVMERCNLWRMSQSTNPRRIDGSSLLERCLQKLAYKLCISNDRIELGAAKEPSKMQEVNLQQKFTTNSKQAAVMSRLQRSKSDCDNRVKEAKLDGLTSTSHHFKLDITCKDNEQFGIKERQTQSNTEKRLSLKREIKQLEKRLQTQFVLRKHLKQALEHSSSLVRTSNDSSMPKPTAELVRDIAVLEVEVRHLEKYLLSLYQSSFDQNPTLFPTSITGSLRQPSSFHLPISQAENAKKSNTFKGIGSLVHSPKSASTQATSTCVVACQEGLTIYGANRSQSSLSQHSVFSASPSVKNFDKILHVPYSQPLSLLENKNSGVISLAEYLGTKIADHVPVTPNKISEEMVRCMGAIYFKLADPPILQHRVTASPSSSFSSMSALSPRYLGDMWSPCKRESTLDRRLENPFLVEGLYELYGPYNAMVEVPSISRHISKLNDVKELLQNYRLLVKRLETVDPRKMTNEERLSFWINIHNALIMHAYLDYGIPQKNLKRASLLIKATCIVGNRTISANILQGSILGCRTHYPGQWLRMLLSSRMKPRPGDEWQDYAIKQPEPLLYFALCSGSHSSPAVRIYTKKRVFHQLKVAKEEYIRATFSIKKEQKILLPKIIELYAKESGSSLQGIMDMVQHYLPETIRMVMQRCQQERSHKLVEWIPDNFSFRYLLSRELAIQSID